MTDATPNPTPTPTPEPNPAPAAKAWHDGFETEDVGFLQNKAWDKPDGPKELLKAYKNLEAFRGAPADQLVKLPKDANDVAGWDTVWNRLGRPGKAEEYALPAQEGDKAYADEFSREAFAAGLSKGQAERLFKFQRTYGEKQASGEETKQAEQAALEQQARKQSWGANDTVNLIVAERGSRALEVSAEDFEKIKTTGPFKLLEIFRRHGQAIGEDSFITGSSQGQKGVYSYEQAVARKAQMMKDPATAKLLINSNPAYAREADAFRKEMTTLNKIISAAQQTMMAA